MVRHLNRVDHLSEDLVTRSCQPRNFRGTELLTDLRMHCGTAYELEQQIQPSFG